jgi:Bacterial Ig-like domain (group 2)/Electron transfer DM13
MIKKTAWALAAVITLAACSKKSAETPVATIPERLEMAPASNSVLVGATATFTLKFFNNTGQQAALPAAITFTSANAAIATVNQQGVATGVSAGQTEIKATYNNVSATALLTVAANNTVLASVTITPIDIQEVKLNETATLTAVGKNNAGGVITGLTFLWQTADAAIADVTTAGVISGKAYGTANVTASASGIQSAPVMVQVIRKGNFNGVFSSAGTAKLKIENGVLKLQTTADFSVMTSPPDLRIYLSNSNNSIAGAVEVASLSQRTGAQSWAVAAPTTITQYKYVIVWCKQFGGTYGVADLGN